MRDRKRIQKCSATGGSRRGGISLFEVILSMVILVTSLAAIGQLIYSGGQGAIKARLMTQAVFLAESKMGEIVSGATPLVAATDVAFPDESNWSYTVTVSNGPQTDLYTVGVEVTHTSNSSLGKIRFDLSRLVRDPGAVISTRLAEAERQAAEDLQKAQEDAAAAATTSSSGGGASGGTGSTGGGSR